MGLVKWVKGVRKYNFALVSHGDVMNSMLTTVNSLLHIWKSLRINLISAHLKKQICNLW